MYEWLVLGCTSYAVVYTQFVLDKCMKKEVREWCQILYSILFLNFDVNLYMYTCIV